MSRRRIEETPSGSHSTLQSLANCTPPNPNGRAGSYWRLPASTKSAVQLICRTVRFRLVPYVWKWWIPPSVNLLQGTVAPFILPCRFSVRQHLFEEQAAGQAAVSFAAFHLAPLGRFEPIFPPRRRSAGPLRRRGIVIPEHYATEPSRPATAHLPDELHPAVAGW